ncbi:MAG: hypothetical protein EON58_00995 [Alphaproteobacteria bacterium]|nr:MAG: hypothetical protein EON58_00995 [Alphaproteobacteria bacterium]
MMTVRERIEEINGGVVTGALCLLRDAVEDRNRDGDVLRAAHHYVGAAQRLDHSRDWRVKVRCGSDDIYAFEWAAGDGGSR